MILAFIKLVSTLGSNPDGKTFLSAGIGGIVEKTDMIKLVQRGVR